MRLIFVTLFLLLLTYCGQSYAALGDVYTVFGGGVVGGVTVGNSNGKLDGTGAAALMETPRGLAIIGDRLFIADSTNNIIRVGNLTSKVVTTLAGKNPDFQDGQGTDAAFKLPVAIVVAPGNDGPIYVVDQGNHAIRTVSLTGVVTTLVGNGTRGYTDGIGDRTQFSFTSNSGMVISADGTRLYVCDTDNRRIRMIVIATKTVSTFSGTGMSGSTNGAATIATFQYPLQMASDGTSLYITDGQPAQTIRKVAIADGSVSSLNIGAPLSISAFTGVAVDTISQTLYIADQGSFVIRSVPLTGGTTAILSGKLNSSGVSDGAGTVAGFSPQISALLFKNNVLYVADADNNKIRGINLVALSTDASLSSLQVYYLSNLIPLPFNTATFAYNLNVGIEMIRLSIKTVPTDPGASLSLRFVGAVTPEFVPLISNTQSQTYPITSGTASTNRFEIKVTAVDGITSQTYVVDVKRTSSTGGNGAASTGASMIVAAVVAIITNMMLYM